MVITELEIFEGVGMTVTFEPIGTLFTPFSAAEGMPIQPSGARGVEGKIVLNEELQDGLMDLEGFSHVWVIYHLHGVIGGKLKVTPFLDSKPHGIFATRSPARPNPIGLSLFRVLGVSGREVHLSDVDVLDGTPVLDIKPFVADFDTADNARFGWFEGKSHAASSVVSDNRFVERRIP